MSLELHFLPWLRGGIGLGITNKEAVPLAPLPRGADITGTIEIDGNPATAQLSVRPPDQVMAIDGEQVSRRYPEPGTPDAEYGYFPHIELVAADLPWVASPAAADETGSPATSTGKLRPWLVLVCHEAALGTLTPARGETPQTLTVDAGELPDLEESWGWAHVQSLVPANEAVEALEVPNGQVIARLICPRRLEANKRYRASLVGAWKHEAGMLHPAWTADDGSVALRVFETWTFITGNVGSFEELCERLGPLQDDSLVFGTNWMDMTESGLLEPWADTPPIRAHYSGALVDANVMIEELDGAAAEEFKTGVTSLINDAGPRRPYGKSGPDPVVSIPFYGSYASRASALPGSGWMPELNLSPRRRAAAGLGAQIVRVHQERLMSEAWDQIGQVREVNRALTNAVLRREVSVSWKARTAQLDATQMLGVLRRQLTFVKDAATGLPVRQKLKASTLPDGAVSPALARAIRPSGVAVKSFTAPLRKELLPGEEREHVIRKNWRSSFEQLIGTEDGRDSIALGKPRIPQGMRGPDPRRGTPGATTPKPQTQAPATHLPSMQTEVQDAIQLAALTRRQVELRVPALGEALENEAGDKTPTRVTGGPVFDEALSVTLMQMSTELIMPGVSEFPENTVHLVQADSAFAAALLAGANHEMIRELLWREYPAAMDHTCFHRFWDRPDPDVADIDAMKGWDKTLPLEQLGAAGGESAVLLVRGDVLRQFPSARFLLLEPGASEPMAPSFSGRIPPDIGYFGFDVLESDVITAPDSDWAIVIEEPSFEPRFGLDAERGSGALTTYSELAWGDLAGQTTDHLTIAGQSFANLNAEAVWGRNSAHMAVATHQKPFRMYFRAVDIIGG